MVVSKGTLWVHRGFLEGGRRVGPCEIATQDRSGGHRHISGIPTRPSSTAQSCSASSCTGSRSARAAKVPRLAPLAAWLGSSSTAATPQSRRRQPSWGNAGRPRCLTCSKARCRSISGWRRASRSWSVAPELDTLCRAARAPHSCSFDGGHPRWNPRCWRNLCPPTAPRSDQNL